MNLSKKGTGGWCHFCLFFSSSEMVPSLGTCCVDEGLFVVRRARKRLMSHHVISLDTFFLGGTELCPEKDWTGSFGVHSNGVPFQIGI